MIKSYLSRDIAHPLQYHETSDMTNSILFAINAVMKEILGLSKYANDTVLYSYREVREMYPKSNDELLILSLRDALRTL